MNNNDERDYEEELWQAAQLNAGVELEPGSPWTKTTCRILELSKAIQDNESDMQFLGDLFSLKAGALRRARLERTGETRSSCELNCVV